MPNQVGQVTVGISLDDSQALRQADALLRRLSGKHAIINLDARSASLALGRISGQASQFSKSLEAANARVLAFTASAGSIFLIERAFRSLIKTTVEVEKSLTDINVILSVSSKNLQKFSNDLFAAANQTGTSFQQAGQAALEFSRQGLGVSETLKRTRDALVLTRISGLDAKSSIEALTAGVNAFQKTAITTTEIINKLARVDANFAVSAADLAEALKRVGSTAEAAGVGFDELIAFVTSAQQITQRGGAVIGNALKSIFTRIQRADTLEQFQELGIAVTDAQNKLLPVSSILQGLAKAFKNDLTPAQKTFLSDLTAGLFQINQFKAIVGDLTSEYSNYSRALSDSRQATDEAISRNEELNKTFSSLLQRTSNNLKNFQSQVGKLSFGPVVDNLLKALNLGLEGINNQSTESVGSKLGAGILTGIGKFLGGPGAIAAGAALLGLSKSLFQFAGRAAKDFIDINTGLEKQRILQSNIGDFLSKQPALIERVRTGTLSVAEAEQLVLTTLREEIVLKERLAAISLAASRNLIGSNTVIVEKSESGQKINLGPKGRVPNFANDPIQDAIGRESDSGIPRSLIRVGISPRLVTSKNPLGFGVYNLRDEPGGLEQGINRVARLGITAKNLVGKDIPSFAKIEVDDSLLAGTKGINEKIQVNVTSATQEFNNLIKKLKETNISFGQATDEAKKIKNIYQLTDTSLRSMIGTLNNIRRSEIGLKNQVETVLTSQTLKRSAFGESPIIAPITIPFLTRQPNFPAGYSNPKLLTFPADPVYPSHPGPARNVYYGTQGNIATGSGATPRLLTQFSESTLAELDAKKATLAKIMSEEQARVNELLYRFGNQSSSRISSLFGVGSFGTSSYRSAQNFAQRDPAAFAANQASARNALQSRAFLASFALPIAAETLGSFIPDTSTTSRGIKSSISGLSNVGSFGATGLVLSGGNPIAGAIGALIGGLASLPDVITKFTDTLPDLTKKFEDLRQKTNENRDAMSRFIDVSQKLSDIESGNVQATVGTRQRLLSLRTESLAKLPPEQVSQLRLALASQGGISSAVDLTSRFNLQSEQETSIADINKKLAEIRSKRSTFTDTETVVEGGDVQFEAGEFGNIITRRSGGERRLRNDFKPIIEGLAQSTFNLTGVNANTGKAQNLFEYLSSNQNIAQQLSTTKNTEEFFNLLKISGAETNVPSDQLNSIITEIKNSFSGQTLALVIEEFQKKITPENLKNITEVGKSYETHLKALSNQVQNFGVKIQDSILNLGVFAENLKATGELSAERFSGFQNRQQFQTSAFIDFQSNLVIPKVIAGLQRQTNIGALRTQRSGDLLSATNVLQNNIAQTNLSGLSEFLNTQVGRATNKQTALELTEVERRAFDFSNNFGQRRQNIFGALNSGDSFTGERLIQSEITNLTSLRDDLLSKRARDSENRFFSEDSENKLNFFNNQIQSLTTALITFQSEVEKSNQRLEDGISLEEERYKATINQINLQKKISFGGGIDNLLKDQFSGTLGILQSREALKSANPFIQSQGGLQLADALQSFGLSRENISPELTNTIKSGLRTQLASNLAAANVTVGNGGLDDIINRQFENRFKSSDEEGLLQTLSTLFPSIDDQITSLVNLASGSGLNVNVVNFPEELIKGIPGDLNKETLSPIGIESKIPLQNQLKRKLNLKINNEIEKLDEDFLYSQAANLTETLPTLPRSGYSTTLPITSGPRISSKFPKLFNEIETDFLKKVAQPTTEEEEPDRLGVFSNRKALTANIIQSIKEGTISLFNFIKQKTDSLLTDPSLPRELTDPKNKNILLGPLSSVGDVRYSDLSKNIFELADKLDAVTEAMDAGQKVPEIFKAFPKNEFSLSTTLRPSLKPIQTPLPGPAIINTSEFTSGGNGRLSDFPTANISDIQSFFAGELKTILEKPYSQKLFEKPIIDANIYRPIDNQRPFTPRSVLFPKGYLDTESDVSVAVKQGIDSLDTYRDFIKQLTVDFKAGKINGEEFRRQIIGINDTKAFLGTLGIGDIKQEIASTSVFNEKDQVTDLRNGVLDLSNAIRNAQKELNKYNQIQSVATDLAKESNKLIRDARSSFRSNNISGSQFRRFVGTANDVKQESGALGLRDISQEFSAQFVYNQKDLMADLRQGAIDFSDTLKSGFKDAFKSFAFEGKSALDALRSYGLQVASKLLDISINSASNYLFSGLGAAGRSIAGAFSTGNGGFNRGGLVNRYSTGGLVTGGSGTKDDVPAVLSSGEYILTRKTVQELGKSNLDQLNYGSSNITSAFDTKPGSANILLKNAFVYDDPNYPTTGAFDIDPRLSNLALEDSNNPQNEIRNQRYQDLINYLQEKYQYNQQKKKALRAFRRQQDQTLLAAYIAAAVNIAGAGISSGFAPKTTSVPSGLNANNGTPLQNSASRLSNPNILGGYNTSSNYQSRLFDTRLSLSGYNLGGMINRYTRGGNVFGNNTSTDNIPALLTDGEYVLQKSVVDKIGKNNLDKLNRGETRGYANGGLVEPSVSTYGTNDNSDVIGLLKVINETLKINKNVQSPTSNTSPNKDSSVVNNVTITVQVSNGGKAETQTFASSNSGKENKSNKDNEDLGNRIAQGVSTKVYEILNKEIKPRGLISEAIKRS